MEYEGEADGNRTAAVPGRSIRILPGHPGEDSLRVEIMNLLVPLLPFILGFKLRVGDIIK